MSIQIIIDGKTRKFTNQMEAISYLANTNTQGFSKTDYDRMINTLNESNSKRWSIVKLEKLKELIGFNA